jgi:hypothetical protein
MPYYESVAGQTSAVEGLRDGVRFLRVRAGRRADRHDPHAVEDLATIGRISRHLSSSQAEIDQLIGYAFAQTELVGAMRLVADHPDDPAVDRFANRLATPRDLPDLRKVAMAKLAHDYAEAAKYREYFRPVPASADDSDAGNRPHRDLIARLDRAGVDPIPAFRTRVIQRYRAALAQWPEGQGPSLALMKRLERSAGDSERHRGLSYAMVNESIFLPAFVVRMRLQYEAGQTALRAGLEIERYRLVHHRFPKTLAEASVTARDPFGAGAMGYHATDRGFELTVGGQPTEGSTPNLAKFSVHADQPLIRYDFTPTRVLQASVAEESQPHHPAGIGFGVPLRAPHGLGIARTPYRPSN